MPNAIDHAEAALELLTLEDLDALPLARLRRLESVLYHWQQLAQMRVSPHAPPDQSRMPASDVPGAFWRRFRRAITRGRCETRSDPAHGLDRR
jgi:hypothetical protein